MRKNLKKYTDRVKCIKEIPGKLTIGKIYCLA